MVSSFPPADDENMKEKEIRAESCEGPEETIRKGNDSGKRIC